MSYAPRILIVDDELEVRAFLEQALSEDGYYVIAVGTAREGLRALGDGEFQVVVLDLSLPDGDGLEVVRQIRGEYPHLSILAISGFMVGDMPSIALAAGARATLISPQYRTNSSIQFIGCSTHRKGGWDAPGVRLRINATDWPPRVAHCTGSGGYNAIADIHDFRRCLW